MKLLRHKRKKGSPAHILLLRAATMNFAAALALACGFFEE